MPAVAVAQRVPLAQRPNRQQAHSVPFVAIDADKWIGEFAYYLWLHEGKPDGRAKHHWRQAETVYGHLRERPEGLQGDFALEVQDLAQIVAAINLQQVSSAEDLAYAFVAKCRNLGKALDKIEKVHDALVQLIDPPMVDDTRGVLKIWRFEQSGGQQAATIRDAIHRFPIAQAGDSKMDKEVQSQKATITSNATAAFERELPRLLELHRNLWVVYHGEERLEVGEDPDDLVETCRRERGLAVPELEVFKIQPGIPPACLSW